MVNVTDKIRFKAKLLRPAAPKSAAWAFLVLPVEASGLLPTRSMVTVDGTLDGHPFQATLEPDGRGSHWLKVDRALREAAGVAVGDRVALAMAPVDVEPEPKVPATGSPATSRLALLIRPANSIYPPFVLSVAKRSRRTSARTICGPDQ